MYYKLGLLLLASGVLCQHQVTQQIQPAPERQIRLEDIERDGLKSAAAQQAPTYQQPSLQQQHTVYQQPSLQQQHTVYHHQPAQSQAPIFHHQQIALQTQQQPHAIYPQFQLAPAATAYQSPQLALHPQQLFHSGALPQQFLYLQPQAHPSYNVPLMIIPYPLQQEYLLPGVTKLRAPVQTAVAQPQQQQVTSQTKFRPSPQVQFPNPYSSQTYQQKFATGVKSTPAPTVKDNYVQQQAGFNFKLQ